MSDREIQKKFVGQLIRENILQAHQLGVEQTANLLRLNWRHFTSILSGRSDLSYGACHRLGIVFAESPELWALRQMHADLTKAEGEKRQLDFLSLIEENKKLSKDPPGYLLQERISEPNKITLKELASKLEIPPTNFYSITIGVVSMPIKACLKLEELYKENAVSWAAHQALHDLGKAKKKIKGLKLRPYSP